MGINHLLTGMILQVGFSCEEVVLKQLTTSQENPQKPQKPIQWEMVYLPTWMVNLYGKCRSIYHPFQVPGMGPKVPMKFMKVFKLYHPPIYELYHVIPLEMKEGCGLFPNLLLPNFLGPTSSQYPTTTSQQMLLPDPGLDQQSLQWRCLWNFSPWTGEGPGERPRGDDGGAAEEKIRLKVDFGGWFVGRDFFGLGSRKCFLLFLTWKCGDVKL